MDAELRNRWVFPSTGPEEVTEYIDWTPFFQAGLHITDYCTMYLFFPHLPILATYAYVFEFPGEIWTLLQIGPLPFLIVEIGESAVEDARVDAEAKKVFGEANKSGETLEA